jgi:dTMP kinase
MTKRKQGKGKQNSPSGLFLTFEGTEGSGKTTQCRQLARWLRSQGYQVLETREPGGTPLAERIRQLILSHSKAKLKKETITPACETMLILAARSQHVTHVILPALAKGMIVLCDRFFDSTLAYQGSARNLDTAFLNSAHQFITKGLQPHLTFFLDLPIQDGLARRQQSQHQNRLDQESLKFHRRVRRGFLSLAKENPQRIQTLNARLPPDTLAAQVASLTNTFIYTHDYLCLVPSKPNR